MIHFLDFNECAAKLDDCDVNANCSDTNDSYNCTCAAGFRGDGRTCTGKYLSYVLHLKILKYLTLLFLT